MKANTTLASLALVAALAGCKGAKPVLLEADGAQIGAGAFLFLVDSTGTGTFVMQPTADYPKGLMEDVKLTEKVDFMTAAVWTLVTEDGKKMLVFAPSPAGWICQSCADYKLPLKWHVKDRKSGAVATDMESTSKAVEADRSALATGAGSTAISVSNGSSSGPGAAQKAVASGKGSTAVNAAGDVTLTRDR